MFELLRENGFLKLHLISYLDHFPCGIPANDGLIERILPNKQHTSKIERVFIKKETNNFYEFLEKELILELFKISNIRLLITPGHP